jgi:hypothetical protein
VAEVNQWEQAHLEEDELRNKVKATKEEYEDALRAKSSDSDQTRWAKRRTS